MTPLVKLLICALAVVAACVSLGSLRPVVSATGSDEQVSSVHYPADELPKTFTLGKDSLSEYGEVQFDHASHALGNRSPDGKSVMGCVECHHTEQPKSALKGPLKTSARDVTLTLEVWKTSPQKVVSCRDCHFQQDNVPEGKKQPSTTVQVGGKSVVKDINNELAFHINCNACHDAAAAQRPELRSKPLFATSKDCIKCHKQN